MNSTQQNPTQPGASQRKSSHLRYCRGASSRSKRCCSVSCKAHMPLLWQGKTMLSYAFYGKQRNGPWWKMYEHVWKSHEMQCHCCIICIQFPCPPETTGKSSDGPGRHPLELKQTALWQSPHLDSTSRAEGMRWYESESTCWSHLRWGVAKRSYRASFFTDQVSGNMWNRRGMIINTYQHIIPMHRWQIRRFHKLMHKSCGSALVPHLVRCKVEAFATVRWQFEPAICYLRSKLCQISNIDTWNIVKLWTHQDPSSLSEQNRSFMNKADLA